jgi:hypothetical protein
MTSSHWLRVAIDGGLAALAALLLWAAAADRW